MEEETENRREIELHTLSKEHEDEEEHDVIVFVHGAGGRVDQFRHQIAYFFDQGFDVFGFDLIGHGNSPKPEDWETYMPDNLVEDMVTTMAPLRNKTKVRYPFLKYCLFYILNATE